MRSGIVLAAAFTIATATAARADEWCGSADHAKAIVECGYTSAADCSSSVGKGGMCFVDPEVTRNFVRVVPMARPKIKG